MENGTCRDDYPAEFVKYNCVSNRLYQPKLETLDYIDAHWYYGPPRTGKSKKARDDNPDAYEKLPNKWWDDYNHEDVVIIDDLDHAHVHMGSFLKRYADHYPFRCEYKGGSKMVRPKKIVVTSNYTIDEIWCADPTLAKALNARFKTTHFNKL